LAFSGQQGKPCWRGNRGKTRIGSKQLASINFLPGEVEQDLAKLPSKRESHSKMKNLSHATCLGAILILLGREQKGEPPLPPLLPVGPPGHRPSSLPLRRSSFPSAQHSFSPRPHRQASVALWRWRRSSLLHLHGGGSFLVAPLLSPPPSWNLPLRARPSSLSSATSPPPDLTVVRQRRCRCAAPIHHPRPLWRDGNNGFTGKINF
jgi:hypothetical protein